MVSFREPALQLKGGLAPWQMRRALELLQEHLDGELKLETLAEECRLSASHFCAIVQRDRLGPSPHRYLTLRRVEIAKVLWPKRTARWWKLRRRPGFSDQAALTRTFASVVGATPGKWRRELTPHRRMFVEIREQPSSPSNE